MTPDAQGGTPDQERLDEVQRQIDHARDVAEDANVLDDPDEPKFHQTGALSDLDDQTIAPPG